MMSLALLAPRQFAASLPPVPNVDADLGRLAEHAAYQRAQPFA